MMKTFAAPLIIAALALVAHPAAASWTMTDDVGTWTGTNGGTNVQYQTVAVAYGNTQQDQVRWGVPYGAPDTIDNQSGLGFTGKAAPAVIFEPGDAFEVGQLVHFNHEIYTGGSPTEAYLQLVMNFTTPAGSATGIFNFLFGVNETPVLGDPDIISFPSSLPAEVVEIGGVTYTLELLGFGPSPDALVSEFVSPENGQPNATLLWARVTEVPTGPPEGLSPGYWKNHPADWPAPYTPGQTLGSVFASSADFDLDDVTLGAALAFKGGNTLAQKAQILLRQAVAALLNAAHPNINYPLSVAEVIAEVNAALDSGDPDTILDLASTLDGYNNLGGDLSS
jgi:hypothetical protein